jgi:hypothetical protein
MLFPPGIHHASTEGMAMTTHVFFLQKVHNSSRTMGIMSQRDKRLAVGLFATVSMSFFSLSDTAVASFFLPPTSTNAMIAMFNIQCWRTLLLGQATSS